MGKRKTAVPRPAGLQQMGPDLYQQIRDALVDLNAAVAR